MAINFKDGVILGVFDSRTCSTTERQTDGDGLQAQTAEQRLEHTLPTELQTSSPKSTTPSGAVGQDLLQTPKQSQT